MSEEERECISCGEVIPPRRIEILPNTHTCVACSGTSRKSIKDMPGTSTVQHTGGLHEKYMKEEDI